MADPYNLDFTPDGTKAIVVPELLSALDFRDPHTFALIKPVGLPCNFPNHMDFTADRASLVVSCEGSGQLVRVDLASMTVTGEVTVGKSPQDIACRPTGGSSTSPTRTSRVSSWWMPRPSPRSASPTGEGTHGMYPSRDATQLYVTNRLAGTIPVISYVTRQVVATWNIPGGSPDMGGVSADGTKLWVTAATTPR